MNKDIHSFLLADKNFLLSRFYVSLFFQNLIEISLVVYRALFRYLVIVSVNIELRRRYTVQAVILICIFFGFLFLFDRMEAHSFFLNNICSVQLLLVNIKVFLHNIITDLADEPDAVDVIFKS